ncbi:MAG: SPFH domain-containing protein [Eubacteriales bacterium]|nr:SPFH domain-containing protein [Eubacteriales bacterium]
MENSVIQIKDAEREKLLQPVNGMVMLILIMLLMLASLLAGLACFSMAWRSGLFILMGILCMSVLTVVGPFLFKGLKILNPNEAIVLTLFGRYIGSIKEPGFYYVNPFASAFNPTAGSAVDAEALASALSGTARGGSGNKKETGKPTVKGKRISLKAMTLNNAKQKVNDVLGNPIDIGVVVIWKVQDTAKAVFNVDNYLEFVSVQTDSALRNVARLYPYDVGMDDNDGDEMSLRGSSQAVSKKLEEEIQERVANAGIHVLEARITHLAYAQEIAAAMLQRQQASAIIDARKMIVEGAVGMVEMALEMLSEKEMVTLDEERKAAMVSNLLVVLCGNKDAQPIVNSGSIY